MLAFKKETEYAIHFLKLLDPKKQQARSLREIAEKTDISFLFLQKIARKLRFAEIIRSDKGAQGGYVLRVSPNKLSLKKIVEVMEGGCVLVACCVEEKDFVCDKKGCKLKNKMKKINKGIGDILSRIKLSDI